MTKLTKCPKCDSRYPERHPAVQFEGEVELCTHDFHLQPTPQNTPAYIAAVLEKRAKTCPQMTALPQEGTGA